METEKGVYERKCPELGMTSCERQKMEIDQNLIIGIDFYSERNQRI